MHEKYVKRTIWEYNCPNPKCEFKEHRAEKPPKAIQCPECRTWISAVENSVVAPEISR